MKIQSRTVRALAACAWLVLGSAPASWAVDIDSPYVSQSMHKLGRGLVNIVTAPGELVRMTEIVGRQDGYLAAASVGLLQGTWRTLLRAVAGVFDTATFFAEIPDDFRPLIHPEFVFAHGSWAQDDPPSP